jgi:adenosine kinase
MFKRVVITGSLAYDHIMSMPTSFEEHIMPDKIHVLNVGFIVDRFNKEFGGTSVNIAYSLSLLETPSLIVASAGNDFDLYKTHLEKHVWIDVSGVKIYKDTTCSQGFVITDVKDNQIWGYFNGAMKNNSKLRLQQYLRKDDLVVVGPNEGDAMIKFARVAVRLKTQYMFDPAFNIPHLSKADLEYAIKNSLILIGNDYEIELIRRRLGWSGTDLKKNIEILITTLGSKGSRIENKGETVHIPAARPKSESDPTGAGDAYRAGFLAGYMRNLPLEICGRVGALTAVYTVEKYGTQTHRFTISDFKRRFRTNFRSDLEGF